MVNDVIINYDGLWKLLIDKKMKKQELREKAGLTHTAMAKLGKAESVHLDVLLKICKVLNCELKDIVSAKVKSEEV